MDSQFHKQTVVYTQWNMIQPFKDGNSDNATMWMSLMIIILSEINQTKKAQAWKPGSQHAGEKRGVAGLLLGRTERAARAAELQLCAQAR